MKKVYEIDLSEYGFVNDVLETKCHTIAYLYYDIGRLSIMSKEGCGNDDVYIEDYFDLDKFINIIHLITDFKIEKKI